MCFVLLKLQVVVNLWVIKEFHSMTQGPVLKAVHSTKYSHFPLLKFYFTENKLITLPALQYARIPDK